MSAGRLLIRDLAQVATPAGRSAPLRGDALGALDVIERRVRPLRGGDGSRPSGA